MKLEYNNLVFIHMKKIEFIGLTIHSKARVCCWVGLIMKKLFLFLRTNKQSFSYPPEILKCVQLQWCPIEMRISHRNERHQPAPILPLLPLFFSGKKEAR